MSKLKFLIILAMILIVLPSVLSIANPNNSSVNPSDYLFYGQMNATDTTTLPNVESGQGLWEASGTSWQIINNSLYADDYPSLACANVTRDGSTSNFTIMINWRSGNTADDGNVRIMNLQPSSTLCTYDPAVALLEGPGAGVTAVNFNGFATGYNQLNGQNITVMIVVDEENNKANVSIYTVSNATGVYTLTQAGAVAWTNFLTSYTSAQFLFLSQDYRTVIGSQAFDEIVAWNWTNQDNALIRPQPSGGGGDTTFPIINATINNTSPKYADFINISANASDETGLSYINYSINFTAGLYKANYSISGTNYQLSNKTQINETRGNVLNLTFYSTDTSNNVKQNSTLITIINTIPNSTLFKNVSGFRDRTNLTINWSSAYDPDLDTLNYIVYWDLDSTPTSLFQNNTKLGFITNWTSDATYFYQIKVMDSESESALSPLFNLTLDTPPQPPSNINWLTTGGFTSGTRLYNEILDWINVTCLPDTGLQSCNITVTDPTGSIAVNNKSMTLVNNNIYSYSTNILLNQAGTWTLTVDANDNNSISSASTTITVNTQNQSIIDGWYGYTQNILLTEDEISTVTGFDYTIIELTVNASKLSDNFKQILNSTNFSSSKNLKIGLNILLDFNYTIEQNKNNFYSNISANFSKLATDPYQDAIKYISLELFNYTGTTISERAGLLNNASSNITLTTSNKFAIYSKVPIQGLDNSYITNTTLKYITAQTHNNWIDSENWLMRNTTSLNRIYNINGTLKDDIKSFHNLIFDVMRGTPVPTTTVGNKTVAELSNGDFIVFNPLGTTERQYLNFSNVSNVNGKDLWDYTNKIYLQTNTNGTGDINISPYSATMVFVEPLDHIQGTWNLFKASSSGQKTFNHSLDNVNDGNYALDNFANKFKIELFDPHYNINSFITYYGWLNASYLNNWSAYSILILDDENHNEVSNLLVNTTNTDLYFYISVADYANTGAWQSGKQGEVDAIIALNDSTKINVFIDGLDTGVGGANFSDQFKTLVDYIKITKGRKVGVNTYTSYQTFCNMVEPNGFCMKESCVRRWNGTNPSTPTAYDWENWELELNKSIWYQNNNVRVLCQSFSNRTSDTFEKQNWTILQDIHFASLVLGYTDHYDSEPDFNYAHTEYFYNAGTNLANQASTDDNQTYYRRYSNGIVYFNTSNHHGWIDDSRTQDVQACFRLYDNSDGAGDEEKDFNFNVNNNTISNIARNRYTIKATDITAGVWSWYCVKLNETDKSLTGSYQIEGSTTNTGQIADGINLGWENTPVSGKHSWWSNIAGDVVWNVYPLNQNWEIQIIVNETKKSSIDSFTTQINQSTSSANGKTNLTLSSVNPFDIEVWSNGITVTSFINLSYWTGSNFARVYPINTSTCNSNNPTWNSTTINSEAHKSCIETIDSTTYVRVATPHLSTQTYQIDNNNPPTVTIIKPVLNTLYNQQPLDINYTFSDADGDAITQVNIYINGTLNQTINSESNTTLNASDGKYNISISAFDGIDWGVNTSVLSFKIDLTNPLLSGISPNATANNSNFNVTAIASDNNLNGFNCTTYNGETNSHSIIFSEEYTNIASTEQSIRLEYNTSWGDGEKLTVCRASDDHTKKEQGNIDYDIDKLFVVDRIEFKKGANLEEDVTFECEDNTDDIKVYKLQDRYSMLFDYSSTKTKGLLNTYNCNLKTNSKIVYRQNSKYKAHFVLGSGIGQNFVDYVFKGNENASYSVSKKSFGYQIVITTTENVLNFSSMGGVNIPETNTTIILDANAPIVNSFNLTGKLNNTFYNYTNISTTINATDLFLSNITIYKNNALNKTSLAFNGTTIIVVNLTEDGNYTLIAEAKDKAGNKRNSSFVNAVIDTAKPIGVNATNRTRTNSKAIFDNTDVNISVFLGDIYLSSGKFSHNASNGVWTNQSITISGNKTYNYVIGSGNFTAIQVVGWKFYAYDLAGNELDPIYTFNVVDSSTPKSATGGGSFTSGAEAGATIFASQSTGMNEESCKQSEKLAWYNGYCYQCEGNIVNTGKEISCVKCNEGFVWKDNNCISTATKLNAVDKLINKIFPYSPLSGMLIILSIAAIVILVYFNRFELKRRLKNGR